MFRTGSGRDRDERFSSVPESGSGSGEDFSFPDYYWRYLYVIDDGNRPSKAPIPNATEVMNYIIPAYATGTWMGHFGAFAHYDGLAWNYSSDLVDQPQGTKVYVSNQHYHSSKLFVFHPSCEGVSLTGVEDGRTVGNEPYAGGDNTYPAGARSNLNVFACEQPSEEHINAWVPDHVVDSLHSLWKDGVVNMTTTAPPVSPVEYAKYLIAATATGIWAGYEDHIALAVADMREPNSVRWILVKPSNGMVLFDQDTDALYWYNGTSTSWESVATSMRFQDLQDVQGDFDAGEDGYAPIWDNGAGKLVMSPIPGGGTHAMEDHTNAAFTAADLVSGNDGKVIAYDHGVGFILQAASVGALNDLTDVTITAPSNGQGVVYNSGTWVNGNPTVAAHNHTLDSLTSVNTTGKAVGDVIRWDGTNWVKRTFVMDDLGDVSTAGATHGQTLVFNSGTSTWAPGSPTASVPNGTGTFAALYSAPGVGHPSVGSWSSIIGTTGFDTSGGQNNPYFTVPSGYSRARITITVGGGVALANAVVTNAFNKLGVRAESGTIGSGIFQVEYSGDVAVLTGYASELFSWTSHIFPVTAGWRLYPRWRSNFIRNPTYFNIELFK